MTETSQNNSSRKQSTGHDIPGKNSFGICDKFIIQHSKESYNKDQKRECKLLKLTGELNEILEATQSFQPEEYPNVFIIVIEFEGIAKESYNNEKQTKIEKLNETLITKFGENRPLVLQLTSAEKNFDEFYYKDYQSKKFQKIDQSQKNFEQFLSFPTFLSAFMSGEIENLDDVVIEKLYQVQNLSLILRVIDASSKMNAEEFYIKLRTHLEKIKMDKTASAKYKIGISTAAFIFNKLDVLCDLLEFEEFPFPENFDLTSLNHYRLKGIVEGRFKLQEAIHADDKQGIKDFRKVNPNLKKAFVLTNKSALFEAIHLKKQVASLQLKSLHFETAENENAKIESLNIEVRILQQMNEENKESAMSHSERSLLSIKMKSKIHNENISEERRRDYESSIEEWCKEVSTARYGKLLLDVVTLCEKLGIFYNFESEYTENMKVDDPTGIAGHTYHKDNTIYIGAQVMSNGKDRRQTVRGHVAHELCHYAMHLVFENSMLPFYENSEAAVKFKKIERECFRHILDCQAKNIDDGCNGIISSIYSLYGKNLNEKVDDKNEIIFQIELIVRVIQILTYYKDDTAKIKFLEEERYKQLFEYFKNYVVPEMEAFLKNFGKRNDVRALNEKAGHLKCIKNLKYEFLECKSVEQLGSGNIVIVTTNQPKLFLLRTFKSFCTKGPNLFDTENVLINANFIDSDDGFGEYKKVLNKHTGLNIFIDCTKGLTRAKIKLLQNKEKHRFIFFTLKENISYEVCLKYRVYNFDFNLNDLTEEGQELMHKTEVNLGGNLNCSTHELLSENFNQVTQAVNKSNREAVEEILEDVPEIIDDGLLNWLVKSSDVTITTQKNQFEQNEDFIFAAKQEKCAVISEVAENGKSWMIKKIKNVESNTARWTIFVDTYQLSNAVNNKLELSDFIINKILKPGSAFGAEIFKKFHKNGKILFLVDGFEKIAPKSATFLAKENYKWNDLKEDTQILLVKTNIMFANYSCSFYVLLKESISFDGKPSIQKDKEILKDFNEIVDDRLLYLLIEPEVIKITTKLEGEKMEKNYDYLFQSRQLVQYKNKGNFKIFSSEEFIKNIMKRKFVIISDMAGSGKSWMMKTFANILRKKYPKRWVTYVDLKQYIKVLKKRINGVDFLRFMAEKILEPTNKFEVKMFVKFYKAGKIFVLLDGFDEIAPKYAKIVSDLAKSFELFGNNQLWIATRDYVEPNLPSELAVDTTFQLDDFKEEDGIKLIASKWVIKDFNEKNIKIETRESIENHENFSDFKKNAENLIKRISKASFRQVGIPQLLNVLADGYDLDDDSTKELSIYNIFGNASDKYIEEWYSRGEIRKKKHLESLDKDMNFNRLHEFLAMKSYYPEESVFCGFNNNNCEWTDEDITSCGIINKDGEYFYFLHETFREFFAAKFIVMILKKPIGKFTADHQEVFKYLLKFLTEAKFRVVRSFLNAALAERSFLKDEEKLQKIADIVEDSDDFSCIFEENHEYLADLIFSVLSKISHEKMFKLIRTNFARIVKKSETSEIYTKFQNFFLEGLQPIELKILIIERAVFHLIIKSKIDIDIFEDLVNSVEAKIGTDFVKKILKFEYSPNNHSSENIFQFIVECNQSDMNNKVRKVFEVLKKYLTYTDIIELMKNCCKPHFDFLESAFSISNEPFKAIWNGIKSFFDSFNHPEDFKSFILNRKKCIFDSVAKCLHDDTQIAFWNLFGETFENLEETKHLIIRSISKQPRDINRFCKMIVNSLNFFSKYFSKTELQEILSIKDIKGANVLQVVAGYSLNIDHFESFWYIFKDLFGSNFYEIVKEEDSEGKNIIHYSVASQHCDTLSSIIEKLSSDEKISHTLIKDLLGHLDKSERLCLSQFEWSVSSDKIESFFEILIKNSKAFFTSSEILEFLQHCDGNGENFLSCVYEGKRKVVEEIYDKTVLELKTENMRAFELSVEAFQEVIRNQNLFETASDLKALALCNNIEIHKISFDFLFDKYRTNLDDLKKLIIQNSISGNNYIQNLLIHNKSFDIINFTIDKIQKEFNRNQVQEILRSKNHKGENFLLIASRAPQDIKTHSALWATFENNFENENNLLLYAAGTNTEIFKFIWDKLETSKAPDELEKLISQTNDKGENILHIAVQSNDKSLVETVWSLTEKFLTVNGSPQKFKELILQQTAQKINILLLTVKIDDINFHRALWDPLLNSFRDDNKIFSFFWTRDSHEGLKNLVNKKDSNGENFLKCLITHNTSEVVKFIIEEKFSCFNRNQIREIIIVGENSNLLHSAILSKDVKKFEILWKIYKSYFTSFTQKFELLKQTDKDGRNLIIAAAESSAEIFKCIWDIVDELIKNGEIAKVNELVEMCSNNGKTILHTCVESGDKELLKIVLNKVKIFYLQTRKSPSSLKNFILKKYEGHHGVNYNLLLCLKNNHSDSEFHEIVLDFVIEILGEFEKIKHLIVEANEFDVSYINSIFINVKNIATKILEILEKKFNEKQLREIINDSVTSEGNLVGYAIGVIDSEGLKKLLELMKKIFAEEEFCELLKNVDDSGHSILYTAIKYVSSYSSMDKYTNSLREIFFLAIKTINEIPSEKTRKMLRALSNRNENILEHTCSRIPSVEMNEVIWDTFSNYLDRSEMLNFIEPINKETLLYTTIFWNSVEVTEFTWQKIKENLDTSVFLYLEKSFKGVNISEKFHDESKRKWIIELLEEYQIRI